MIDTGSTSLVRRFIGREFAALRIRAGLTQQQAAAALDKGRATLARIETGDERVRFREVDVRAMLKLYGATPAEAERLLGHTAETRNNKHRGWWHDYLGSEIPLWFAPYITLEDAALRIKQYEVELVPGLLQTRRYAELVMRTLVGLLSEEEIERRVTVRMERQALLTRPRAPHLDAILNEAILQRPVDGGGVMIEQLHHLLDITQRASVSVRILPWSAGVHAGMAACGPFTLMDFPTDPSGEPLEPPLAYVDTLTGAMYLNKAPEIAAHRVVWEDIARRALDEPASRNLITTTLKEMER